MWGKRRSMVNVGGNKFKPDRGYKTHNFGPSLPKCNFVTKVSPPHYSRNHGNYGCQPVARQFSTHQLGPRNTYRKNWSSSWHRNFSGQTKLNHFGFRSKLKKW
jgi:hypothetical protein